MQNRPGLIFSGPPSLTDPQMTAIMYRYLNPPGRTVHPHPAAANRKDGLRMDAIGTVRGITAGHRCTQGGSAGDAAAAEAPLC